MEVQLPLGWHKVSIVGVNISEDGETFLIVQFEADDGRRFDWRGPLAERGWQYTERGLQDMGWIPLEEDYRFDLLLKEGVFDGVKFLVGIQDKEFRGETRRQITRIKRLEPGVKLGNDEALRACRKFREQLIGRNDTAGKN